MSIPHILSQILNTPLFLSPDKLEVIMSLLLRRHGGEAGIDLSHLISLQGGANAAAARAEARPLNASPVEQIAVISALGSMVNRNHGFDDGSGLRSYRTLTADVIAAANDPEIGGIILDMDSFGGMAAGCERASRIIADAAQLKPIYAVVDLNCFSACYWLASACSRIILTDASAGVGSVGCIALHHDQSQRNEKEGDVYTAIYFGERKNDGNPHEPLNKDMFLRIQRSVDLFGMKFAQSVAELRGLELDKVLATKAGVYYGQDAVAAGLADEIAPFDEAVAMLAAEIRDKKKSTFTGGSAMTTKDRIAALLANEDGPAALAELGYVKAEEAAAEAHAKGKAEGLEQGMKQAMENVAEVADLAELAQLDAGNTIKLIKQGCNATEARTAIQTMRAEQSKKTIVLSTVNPANTGSEKHGLIAACEAMNKTA